MTKQHFIALADTIKDFNAVARQDGTAMFTETQIAVLAGFCEEQSPRFNRSRWLDYINGQCGPNGGAVKHMATV